MRFKDWPDVVKCMIFWFCVFFFIFVVYIFPSRDWIHLLYSVFDASMGGVSVGALSFLVLNKVRKNSKRKFFFDFFISQLLFIILAGVSLFLFFFLVFGNSVDVDNEIIEDGDFSEYYYVTSLYSSVGLFAMGNHTGFVGEFSDLKEYVQKLNQKKIELGIPDRLDISIIKKSDYNSSLQDMAILANTDHTKIIDNMVHKKSSFRLKGILAVKHIYRITPDFTKTQPDEIIVTETTSRYRFIFAGAVALLLVAICTFIILIRNNKKRI